MNVEVLDTTDMGLEKCLNLTLGKSWILAGN
jgi:hypothetical protein